MCYKLAVNLSVNLRIWLRQNMSWWSQQIRGYSCGKQFEKGHGKAGEKCRGKYVVKLLRKGNNFATSRQFVVVNTQ
jgi:hypothetical protein